MTTTFRKEVRARLEAATPGPYDARVSEFSNHALCEVWTEFGWYQQLPRDYREPTTELFAHAPSDLDRLERIVECYEAALKEIELGAAYASTLKNRAFYALATGAKIAGEE